MGRGELNIRKGGSDGGPATLLFWEESEASYGGNPVDSWLPKTQGSSVVNDPWVPVADVIPNITTGATVSFGSFPAGRYQVYYLEGALQYRTVSGPWWLNAAGIYGYRILHSGGIAELEGPYTTYSSQVSQAAVEAANAGAMVEFDHAGGTIGMYLHDTPLSDNAPGTPNPTFRLVGLPTTINNPVHGLIATRGKGSLVLSDGISTPPSPSVFSQLKTRFQGGYDFSGGKANFQSQVAGANPVNSQDFVTLAYLASNYFDYASWLASNGIVGGTNLYSKFTPSEISLPDVDAIFQPAGAGALLGQLPDLTPTGGNLRGSYAVDWQRDRVLASEVASGAYSVASGGLGNTAGGDYSTIGGGERNLTGGIHSTVAGGTSNVAYPAQSTIAGGGGNVIDPQGVNGTIGGGANNYVNNVGTTVSGGTENEAWSSGSTVIGGVDNIATHAQNTILGGSQNRTTANGAFALGFAALANHAGSFVNSSLNSGGAASSAADQYTLNYVGGYRFLSAGAEFGGTVSGSNPSSAQHFVTKAYGDANYGGGSGTLPITEAAYTGAKDGVNTVFTMPDTFAPGSVRVYRNGMRLSAQATHFTTTAPNIVTLADAPLAIDNLIFDYFI